MDTEREHMKLPIMVWKCLVVSAVKTPLEEESRPSLSLSLSHSVQTKIGSPCFLSRWDDKKEAKRKIEKEREKENSLGIDRVITTFSFDPFQ